LLKERAENEREAWQNNPYPARIQDIRTETQRKGYVQTV